MQQLMTHAANSRVPRRSEATITPAPSTSAPVQPRGGARLARSLDGRWLAVATTDTIWLEDARTRKQHALLVAAGDDLAVSANRVWVARGGCLESISTTNTQHVHHALELGADLQLTGLGVGVVVASSTGTVLIRESGESVVLAEIRMFVRAIGETRVLLLDPDRGGSASGGGVIADVAGVPAMVRLATTAPILDATALLDRTTCMLLLDRGTHQELAIMRGNGSVLVRIRVNRVERIVGATRALRVVLAVDDGRVVVYDLRERRAVSADRPSQTACEVSIDPDGREITGVARHGALRQLFVRRCA